MQPVKTVLIFGAAGQLGVDCQAVMRLRSSVIPLDLPDVDIIDRGACHQVLDQYRPDLIINCAAWTDVDGAESQPEQARRVNAEAPESIAAWVERNGSWLIHISTDFVFDGSKPTDQAYDEDDDPHPLSVYGKTKLAGETGIQKQTQRATILRTAWLYGLAGRNFPQTILRKALASPDRELKVVDDQYGSPTWSLRLARQVERMAVIRLPGLFHASAEGQCSWYGFAHAFLEAMNISCRLTACTSDAFPRAARRPANSTLENQRLKAVGHNVMRDWQADMICFVNRYRRELMDKVIQDVKK